MQQRTRLCRPRAVSGNRRFLSVFALLLAILTFSSTADTFANPSSGNTALQSGPEKPACSMKNFFSDVKQFFGIRYRFGGQSTEGFDCSGFVRFMYDRVFSTKLPRTSIEMASIGQKVERSELKPGDLVFFQTRGNRISHVGIFVGNDTFVHSSVSKGITEDRLQQKYYDTRFAGAVRVLDNIIPDFPSLPLQSDRNTEDKEAS
ncbi:MAG: NlpC/P60 family protein [Chlorobi bacterium]|nr:NlpC/P60 family protein [Chlorobiota bacterium]